MDRKFNNKSSDSKKWEQQRRTELAMLGLLIEKYPEETREKVRKLLSKNENNLKLVA